MIHNILDQRRNEHNARVDVVFEVWDYTMSRSQTEWIEHTTITEAVEMAMNVFDLRVTMFLYDGGWIRENFNLIPMIHPYIKDDPYEG